jgi:hypothetical protein
VAHITITAIREKKMSDDKIKKLAEEIMTSGREIIDRIKSVHGVEGAISAIPDVLIMVEKKAAELTGLSGAEKKQLAIEILNTLIDVPLLPEAIEGKLIGIAIDAAVAALNKIAGKEWIKLYN